MDLRLVIFDVDGTLVDSQAEIIEAMHAAFAALGRPAPDRDQILSIVGLSLPVAMKKLAPNARDHQLDAMVDAYKTTFRGRRESMDGKAHAPLYPNVLDVMQDLHAQPETLLGVATGKSRRGLNALVDAYDLGSMLVTQQCADDHPSKPHPAMIEAALAETGVSGRRAVMVGDTSYDMQMARAAGVLAIGVSWGYHTADKLTDAHMVIDDIRLLPGLLEQIWSQVA